MKGIMRISPNTYDIPFCNPLYQKESVSGLRFIIVTFLFAKIGCSKTDLIFRVEPASKKLQGPAGIFERAQGYSIDLSSNVCPKPGGSCSEFRNFSIVSFSRILFAI